MCFCVGLSLSPTSVLALEFILLLVGMEEPASAHWCHQCSAQTAAQHAVGGSHGDLICADCGGGFIESLESAQALIHVRRAVRRHQRSQQRRFRIHSAALRRLEATISEADLNSPAFRLEVRSLVHLMDLLPLHSRSSGLHDATSSDVTDEAHDADVPSRGTAHTDHVLGVHGMPLNARIMQNEIASHGELVSRVPLNGLSELGHEENEFFSHVNTNNAESRLADFGLDESVQDESHEHEGEVGSMRSQNNVDGDDEVSDSDVEVSALELSDWDSFDEDEWEYDEDEIHVRNGLDDDVQDGGAVGHVNEGSQARSPLQNARIPHDVLRRLNAISRNIQNFNAEMGLENLNLDTYVGNPADYVDARGFEELLQQFMDSDNTRRGSPPAAKSAIEGLPTVLVQQEDVENGSDLCAICKDVVELNEPAKQLPCLHLYHSECILPWLTTRNSCPMCRHELPTDDPDYEEQRKHEIMWQNGRQQVGGNSDSSSVSHEAGAEELGREGNLGGESIDTETDVLFSDTSKGEVGDDSETRGCPSTGHHGNRHSRERGSLLDVIASPLFSVIGLVVVSCLGNLLLGSSSQRRPANNQASRTREMQSGRSWWTNFFG